MRLPLTNGFLLSPQRLSRRAADERGAEHPHGDHLGATSERINRGKAVNIIPNPFRMAVGEVVRIRNDDTIGFTVGPFYVGPNETMTQKAISPGTFRGVCALHSGDELTKIITKG